MAVTDADTAPDELEFELVEGPVHGTLLRVDFGSQTPMVNGRSFQISSMCLLVHSWGEKCSFFRNHKRFSTRSYNIVFLCQTGYLES